MKALKAPFKVVMTAWLLASGFGLAARETEPEQMGAAPVMTTQESIKYLGQWMWDRETRDKQTCRFWKKFDIPKGSRVVNAQLRIAADNAYTLFLDGRELGRGSDWRTVSVYDLSWLVAPGRIVPISIRLSPIVSAWMKSKNPSIYFLAAKPARSSLNNERAI
jgi:hypothetical protein